MATVAPDKVAVGNESEAAEARPSRIVQTDHESFLRYANWRWL
jgi:hypothetical protein